MKISNEDCSLLEKHSKLLIGSLDLLQNLNTVDLSSITEAASENLKSELIQSIEKVCKKKWGIFKKKDVSKDDEEKICTLCLESVLYLIKQRQNLYFKSGFVEESSFFKIHKILGKFRAEKIKTLLFEILYLISNDPHLKLKINFDTFVRDDGFFDQYLDWEDTKTPDKEQSGQDKEFKGENLDEFKHYEKKITSHNVLKEDDFADTDIEKLLETCDIKKMSFDEMIALRDLLKREREKSITKQEYLVKVNEVFQEAVNIEATLKETTKEEITRAFLREMRSQVDKLEERSKFCEQVFPLRDKIAFFRDALVLIEAQSRVF